MGRRLEHAFYKLDREKLLVKQNNKCFYCKTPLTKKTATMDHVVARKFVKHHSTANCVVSCFRCNQRKGHKPKEDLKLEEWEILLAEGLLRLQELTKQAEFSLSFDTKGGYRKWRKYWNKRGRWNK
jgi:CRISPR/Cas system Type II protein with McrA/HNH and RuvC-like nuclease domain